VSGRLRNNARFVMLVPKSLDPAARGRRMPLPEVRPSQKIAKLFPQVEPLQGQQKDQKQSDQTNAARAPEASAAVVAQASTPVAAVKPVPLPEARPSTKPVREMRRHRHHYDDRYLRVR
jgi:membrane-bound lytic murein transglycosylase A